MFSLSDEFRKSLYSSLEKEYNKLCINGILKDSVRKDLMKSDKSNGVQDIISGLSLNKNRVKWGHSTEYWKRKGQEQGVSRETMAHFSAALADPDTAAGRICHEPGFELYQRRCDFAAPAHKK